MRALLFHDAYSVSIEEVPDPDIRSSTDAVVRVVAPRVCGSDLWFYRGESARGPGARTGQPGLLAEVRDGPFRHGAVLDLEVPFEELPEGYRAMDERRAIKAMARVS